jgi:putative FmdB family regulatory protein
MPVYEYRCTGCKKMTELICSVRDHTQIIRCACGKRARRVVGGNSVLTDGKVKWMESARQALQNPGERPILTRGEWKQYLTTHGLVCKG